jgi:hypothetical protein
MAMRHDRPTRRKILLACAHLILTTTPVDADEIPAGCMFYKAATPNERPESVQFFPGGKRSFVEIRYGYGMPVRCRYSRQATSSFIGCNGHSPEPFSFVGPTIDVQTFDILVFRNAAWYKVCYEPV